MVMTCSEYVAGSVSYRGEVYASLHGIDHARAGTAVSSAIQNMGSTVTCVRTEFAM
jgi:hypothetical protein